MKIVLSELQFLRSEVSVVVSDFNRNSDLRNQLNTCELEEKVRVSYESRIGTNTFETLWKWAPRNSVRLHVGRVQRYRKAHSIIERSILLNVTGQRAQHLRQKKKKKKKLRILELQFDYISKYTLIIVSGILRSVNTTIFNNNKTKLTLLFQHSFYCVVGERYMFRPFYFVIYRRKLLVYHRRIDTQQDDTIKVKRVKLSLCLTNKHYAMKAYGGVDV
jgi:hypothetical protein